MKNILGISLGSRLLGMAVVFQGELSYFRVRTFYGIMTQKKRDRILALIRRTIERYNISILNIKTPHASHFSKGIRDTISDIRQLSSELGIKLGVCTIYMLRNVDGATKRANKDSLIQDIILKYPQHPQLAKLYSKERRNRSAYHVKLFEAIACAEIK